MTEPVVPFPYSSAQYIQIKDFFNAEDVISSISLPIMSKLMSNNANWKDAVKGSANQILSRYIVMKGPTMNVVTQHSVQALVAGVLLPLENMLLKKIGMGSGSEGFWRTMSKGTVNSLIAGSIGATIGDMFPIYM